MTSNTAATAPRTHRHHAPARPAPQPSDPTLPDDGGCDFPWDPFGDDDGGIYGPKGPGGSAGYPFTSPPPCGGMFDIVG